ncbi:hypothetical protein FBQ81_10835 [Chloroflexi bacterium CFX6]|nr:hypothetical protein [Chloroflexi bacterium CFX6]
MQRNRVLRGGSFNNNHRNARCANRNRNNPNNFNNNRGFRVASSHIIILWRRLTLALRRKCDKVTAFSPRH